MEEEVTYDELLFASSYWLVLLLTMTYLVYTPQNMFLLAFSFANYETTRGSTWKANMSFLYLLYNYLMIKTTLPKKVTPQFSKFANEKQKHYLGSVHTCRILPMTTSHQCGIRAFCDCPHGQK